VSYKEVNGFKAKLDISTDNITSCVIPFSVAMHICFFHFNVSFLPHKRALWEQSTWLYFSVGLFKGLQPGTSI